MKLPFLLMVSTACLLHAELTLTELGEMVVSSQKSSLSEQVDHQAAEDFARQNLAESLSLIPGISLQRTGARAESGITLRGFDLRQVPIFIDGIPVYVPYDGYPDLGRFSIPDTGTIEVAKGISSALDGPNALGGLVNYYSKRPEKPLEGSLRVGAFSGCGQEANMSAGGIESKGYWQFDLSWIKQDAFPLSGDFRPVPSENGGQRENSWSEDWRASGRVAWTPSVDDEYTLGIWIQRGEKGNPPYTGNDPAIQTRFWKWPQWDKDTYYLLTKTALSPDNTLETKFHFDRFQNTLESYDNATYSTQTKPYAFTSLYDDWTAGGSAQFDNRSLTNTRISAALHYKLDHHEEMNLGKPRYTFEDQTYSFGLETEHDFHHGTTVTAGISHDWQEVNEAVDTNTGAPINGDSVDSWNPEILLKQELNEDVTAHFGYARKSRFATIKDRYSYRLGQAIPNPDLQPETANHFDLGLDGKTHDGRYEYSTGLFYSRVDDAIQRVDGVAFTPPPVPKSLFQLQNVGVVDHYGFEFSVNAKWNPILESGLRYAWTQAENQTNPALKVTNTPENEIFLFNKLRLSENFCLIPSYTWSDSRYVTTAGKSVGIYSKMDIKAELSISAQATLGFGVTNLLDRNQELDEGFPEEGRSYLINLSYVF